MINTDPKFCFSFTKILQHTCRLWSRISQQRAMFQYWSVSPSSSGFSPVPSIDISIEGTALLWYYWQNYECDERAEKVLIKWLPGMFPALV